MIEAFHRARTAIGKPLPNGELLASACMATARSIAQSIGQFLPHPPDQLIVSGGGTLNGTIMQHLKNSPGIPELLTTDALGIPSAAKEAIAFAILAAASLDGDPSNVPSATGASRRAILGSITPGKFSHR
jgi:anhydro-N-acetylmuramic acid kinase